MRKFFNRKEMEEEKDMELDVIDLDETAGWSKLDIAHGLEQQTLTAETAEELLPDIKMLEQQTEAEPDLEEVELQVETETQQEEGLEYLSMEEEEEESETNLLASRRISGKGKRSRKSSAGFLSRINTMDMVMAGTGLVILIVSVITGLAFLGKRGTNQQIEALAPIGEQLETVGIMGKDTLLAVADAHKAMQAAAQIEEELQKEYEEEELSAEVQVSMKLTSVQKDLKIKFINSKTGKLVGNVQFEVKITDPGGKSHTQKDEDKDGIIYLTNLEPGSYKVAMVELADMGDLSFSTAAETIKVKENIDYQKIDVSNEIKNASEVNVAKEDTAAKVETEATLTDTVEWVESTKTEISSESTYVQINKSDIADPAATASISVVKSLWLASAPSGEGDTQEPPTENPDGEKESETENPETSEPDSEEQKPDTIAVTKVELSQTSLTLEEGKTVNLVATVSPDNATDKTVTWTSSQKTVAEVDDKGKVTALKAGDTVITAKAGDKTVACTIKVTAKTVETTISLDKTSASLKTGETLILKATVTPEGKTLSWTSSKPEVAAVDNGKVTAKAAGETTVTVTADGKSASCKITVTAVYDPKTDTTKALTDKSGNTIYYFLNDKYVEAKVADYYKYNTFYKKTTTAQYKYTGWQNIDGKTYYFDKNGNKVTGEQVIQGAKYTFNSDGSLHTGSGILGIDVSTWNGTIDWNQVKNSGVSYVIIRTGFRGSTQGALVEDARFKQNIQGATNAGLKVGVYFFTQAINEVEAVEEASMVLSQIKNYKITYPVFIDVESSGGRADGLDAGTRTKVINAFCQTIQNGGYRAGIYANKTWLSQKMNISALSGYKIWLAQYNTQVTYGGRYDMWQYSDKGKIAGISTSVDMNLSYMSY